MNFRWVFLLIWHLICFLSTCFSENKYVTRCYIEGLNALQKEDRQKARNWWYKYVQFKKMEHGFVPTAQFNQVQSRLDLLEQQLMSDKSDEKNNVSARSQFHSRTKKRKSPKSKNLGNASSRQGSSVNLQPYPVDIPLKKAKAAIEAGQYEDALELLKLAHTVNSTDPEIQQLKKKIEALMK